MKPTDIRPRQIVRVAELARHRPLMVGPEYLEARREGARGVVDVVVPIGDDLLAWVRHCGRLVPYFSSELALVGEPCDG